MFELHQGEGRGLTAPPLDPQPHFQHTNAFRFMAINHKN